MGLFLIGGMFAGCILGLVVTVVLGGTGVVVAIKSAKIRVCVWSCFTAAFAILLSLCIAAVHKYPYGTVRPGSDYGIWMKNLFLQGFGYCASPGLAALLGAFVTLFAPKKSTNTIPKSNI